MSTGSQCGVEMTLTLDTHTKLKHMTLHFLKYAGKIAEAKKRCDHDALSAILLDAFIICLATANALNVSVGAAIESTGEPDIDSLAKNCARGYGNDDLFDAALIDLVIVAGQMAKSIESTDHLERGNPRADLEALIVTLSSAVLALNGALGEPLESRLRSRWAAVEAKSIFHRANAR